MSETFRLGLIGAGRMGRTHIRALQGSDQVAVTSIAEVAEPVRAAAAAAGVTLHASIGSMLDGGDIDGVLIAAPSDQHGKVIAEVAARGLPILCEKPCGVVLSQTRAAVQSAASAGVPLQIAYWRRYVPALRALRDQILGGDLGVLHLVSCYQWDEQPPWQEFRAHSGGIAVDMGVHEFDQIRWLTGREIGTLAAVTSPAAQPGGDSGTGDSGTGDPDSAQIILALSGGVTGLVSLGRWHPAGDMARAEAFGTLGTARCDFLDPAEGESAQLAALRLQAESFATFARGGPCDGSTGADAIAALDAAERAGAAITAAIAAQAESAARTGSG